MKKILLIIICLFLASIGTATAATLTLETSTPVVAPCTYFNIDLVVSGLGDFAPLSVGDFDIDILYDPTLMEFVSYDLGVFLGDVDSGEALDWSWGDPLDTGAIDLAEVSLLGALELDALQPSEFILAELAFHCLGPGVSDISIDGSNPYLTYKVGNEFGGMFDVTLGGPLTITQTPEPATMLLLGTGLAGLGVFRRKFKK